MQLSPTYRTIWRLAAPVMVAGLGQNVIVATDTAFLGRVGQAELAATSLGGIFYFVALALGLALGMGLQVLVARRAGENNYGAIGRLADHGLLTTVAFGAIGFILLQYVAPPMLHAIMESEAVWQATVVYLKVRAWGVVFGMLFWVFRGLYTGIGRNQVITTSFLVMAVVNIGLNYVLIFGKLGFPELGIAGAAWASAAAELSAVLVLAGNVFAQGYHRQFGLYQFRKLSWEPVLRTLRVSAPMVLQHLISIGAYFFFFLVLENLGEEIIAASNLTRAVYHLGMVPVWGFGTAVGSIVSNVIGQGKSSRVGIAVKRSTWLSAAFTAVLALPMLLLPELFLSMFTNEAHLVVLAVPSMRIVAFALVLMSIAVVLLHGVIGTGATLMSMYFEIILIAMYVSLLFLFTRGLGGGMNAAWMVEICYWIGMIGLSWWYLARGNWRKLKM